MSWQAWFTLAVVAAVFVSMARNWGSPDILLLSGTILTALVRIITPADAFNGFANEGVLTVGALYVVVAGLRETGALEALSARALGGVKSSRGALARLAVTVTPFSAFIHGTPIVAMLIPIVSDWCRKRRIAPSRMLIPVSYFTIMGGMCTLIGTNTNLVVSGLLTQAGAAHGDPRFPLAFRPLALFEITPLGAAASVLGALYLVFIASRFLPDRMDALEQLGAATREYLADLVVQPGCRLIGQSVEEAGLRHLPGLFLVEIVRQEHRIAPVAPDEVLAAGDRLIFTGVVSSIVDLERIPGLVPAVHDGYDARGYEEGRRLCEAVISAVSPLVGKTIREAEFRAVYNAAVIAVHRGGARLTGRVGDIELRPGDTLLLQTGPHFARAHRNNADFFLVSSVEDSRPLRHDRALLSLGILGLMVGLMVSRVLDVELAAFTAATLMIFTRCISTSDARESISWQLLITIAAALGLARALEKSGAAGAIAGVVVHAAGGMGPVAVLAAVYLVTMLFAEVITHYAAAALMFPFALATAHQLGVSPRPFAIAIMFAASFAFATPVGYVRNMMVYGAGAYRFTDFTRVGLPLNFLLWLLSVGLIPVLWPFR